MELSRPNSIQAEKSILGTMLVDPSKISHCVSVLVEDDFYNKSYREIFKIIKDLFDNRQAVDITSVTDKLSDLGLLDDIGGVAGLVDLTETVSIENVTYYVEILKDKTNLRALADFLEKSYKEFNTKQGEDIHKYLDTLENEFLKISRFRSVSDFIKAKDLVSKYDDVLKNKNVVRNTITTGYDYFNRVLNGGWGLGTLNILAARTGVGKTALALNFAMNAAKAKIPVAFFSAEMSADEILCRMISISSSIDNDKVVRYDFKTNEDLMRLQHAMDHISDLPIYIDDTANIRLIDLVAKARKLKAENPALGLIVVDYLQLIPVDANKNDTQALKVGKVATELKKLARDLNIPVIALAQLSRNADRNEVNNKGEKLKTVKKPTLSDLKDSGQIEQDADLVLFLYKENVHGEDSNPPLNEEVQLIIGKNRSGEKRTIYLVSTLRHYQYKEKMNQEDSKPDIGG